MPVEIELVSPFPLVALPRLWGWSERFRARVADDFAPKDLDSFIDSWFEAESRGRRSWGVIRDSELGGAIISDPMSQIARDIHVIFKKEFWGRETTLAALRQVCGDLFGAAGNPRLEKISAFLFIDNASAIELALAAGFKREGKMSGQAQRGGKLIDIAVMGLTRKEFEDGVSNRRVQQQQHIEHVSVQQDGDHQPKPDAIPNESPGPGVLANHEAVVRPIRSGGAVPATGEKPGKPELLRAR